MRTNAPIRKPPSGVAFDLVEAKPIDVNQMCRGLDLQLHQIKQIGPASDEFGAIVAADRRGSVGWRFGAFVGERLSLRPPCDFGNRLGNVRVSAAATDVAAHAFAQFGYWSDCGVAFRSADNVARNAGLDLVEDGDGRANLAWRAVAALIPVMLDECRLHRVHMLRGPETFDRGHVVVLMHDRKRETGVDAPTIDNHRAGAALTVVAAFLGAGQMQMLAQRVEQGGPCVEFERARRR